MVPIGFSFQGILARQRSGAWLPSLLGMATVGSPSLLVKKKKIKKQTTSFLSLLSTLSKHACFYISILRTFFERRGVTKKATTCLTVSTQLHFFMQGMAYDNCHGHSEADAGSESTTTEVSSGAVCDNPGFAGTCHGTHSESLV
jgi:hypothetical protein